MHFRPPSFGILYSTPLVVHQHTTIPILPMHAHSHRQLPSNRRPDTLMLLPSPHPPCPLKTKKKKSNAKLSALRPAKHIPVALPSPLPCPLCPFSAAKRKVFAVRCTKRILYRVRVPLYHIYPTLPSGTKRRATQVPRSRHTHTLDYSTVP